MIIKTPSLRERALGVLEGLTYQEIKDALPRDYEQHTSGDPNYKPDGGESWIETQDRLKRHLMKLRKITIMSKSYALRTVVSSQCYLGFV